MTPTLTIYIGSDHAGYQLKELVARHLREERHRVEDKGAHCLDITDYPDWAVAVARAVRDDPGSRGVLICGSGIGVSIAANKVSGIRAANVHEPYSAELARRHNDAQVVCLGARIVGPDLAIKIVEAFLATPFDGGRHAQRVDKLNALDRDDGDGDNEVMNS